MENCQQESEDTPQNSLGGIVKIAFTILSPAHAEKVTRSLSEGRGSWREGRVRKKKGRLLRRKKLRV